MFGIFEVVTELFSRSGRWETVSRDNWDESTRSLLTGEDEEDYLPC